MYRFSKSVLLLFFVALFSAGFAAGQDGGVKATVDQIARRMNGSLSGEQLLAVDEETVRKFVTDEDREVLSTRHWQFDVNVPVVVYVMRETGQKVAPFWLEEKRFEKTNLFLEPTERNMKFEVWLKAFPAGRVGLGINGFDKHRPHYFVAVKPQGGDDKLEITNCYPAWQEIHPLQPGAFYYHDWSELAIEAVPEEMQGAFILPTMRGRAREAHFVGGGFRKTAYPSSELPDQVTLTWPGDARSSIAVQWRTNPQVESGVVRYRKSGEAWTSVAAQRAALEDKFIVNDLAVHHFTAVISGLESGTEYEYCVQRSDGGWTEPERFKTAAEAGEGFTFAWLSDTHNKPDAGQLLAKIAEVAPATSFFTVSGDFVGTGQYREDWDAFFAICGEHLARLPLAPAIGNHDAIDGLGADLYLAQFALPENGPTNMQAERAYSFSYGDALFVILDVIDPTPEQTVWLEDQLKGSKQRWKFVIFHFPPYAPEPIEPQIIEQWVPVFDRHHVDFVLSGHVHDYVRTHPLKGGQIQKSPEDGTIYLVTVSVPGREVDRSNPMAAVYKNTAAALANIFTITPNRATMKCIDAEGNVHDELVVEK